MECPEDIHKLLRQIISQEPRPMMSEEDIHFDLPAMKVMGLVGAWWVL